MPIGTVQSIKPSKQPPRRFGLEFEHISKQTLEHLSRLLADNGIAVMGSSHDVYTGWQVKHDGSITPQHSYPFGIELASPPLVPARFPELVKVINLASIKGAVNSSCGLHCHVSAPELATALTRSDDSEVHEYVKKAWLSIEKVMFSYVPPSRRHSNYCRPGVAWSIKYQAINFSPLHDRRTIEFRLHNATLNPIKAFSFAMLCRGLVQAMVERREFPIVEPAVIENTKPKHIRTRRGTEFYLQRDKSGKWLIEAKKLKVEVPELPEAFKEFKKHLGLQGKDYLAAFQYPQYGNAMTQLCKLATVNGMFRGYIEDRYDRMIKKHGVADPRTQAQNIMPDEADFYHEPDYDPQNAQFDEPYRSDDDRLDEEQERENSDVDEVHHHRIRRI